MTSARYKILAFTPYYPPHIGGLEKYAAELHHQLAERGHAVTVFTPNIPPTKGANEVSGITTIRFPAFDIIAGYPVPKFWHQQFRSQFSVLRQQRFDITFSYTRFFLTSPLAALFKKRTNTPWLHIEHGSDFVASDQTAVALTARLVDETIGRLVFRMSDANVAPSQSARRFIQKFDSRSVPVIYRGLPYDRLGTIAPDNSIRTAYQNKVIISYAGRLISGKGVADLVSVAVNLPGNSITILLIGDGPERRSLQASIDRAGLQEIVHLLGPKPPEQTIAILKASDIIVNPSYNEGLPTTVLEAAVVGKPVIAAKAGGTAEIVVHNRTGLLYKPGDTVALQRYLQLLISSASLRQQLGHAAQRHVRRQYNWTKAIQQFEVKIKSVINHDHRAAQS